jgi:hypothetical protein
MNDLNLADELVVSKIFLIRNQKVMLDSDLAELYQVETRRLNEQVKRNLSRFPSDFMFQLTETEWTNLMSHFATSSSEWGGRSKMPYAFTEHGVLMLSSVLGSERAIQVNIQIMRIYTKLRGMLLDHKDILLKLERLEHTVGDNATKFEIVFTYLKELLTPEPASSRAIGFKRSDE